MARGAGVAVGVDRCGTGEAGEILMLASLTMPAMAAGLKRGISASGGGGIGRVVKGASASATWAGVW